MRHIILITLSFLLFSCGNSDNSKTAISSEKPDGYFEGGKLYNAVCAACHDQSGVSKIKIYPPLKNSDYLKANQSKIACIIKNGINEPLVVNGETYKFKMNGFPEYTAQEVSQIINYINNSWGNNYGSITTEEVKSQLKACK